MSGRNNMTTDKHETGRPKAEGRESYTHGYGGMVAHLLTRNARRDAAFFLPHLNPGMSLLDCGCGPGGITVGLAEAIMPGQAVGIEIDPGQVEKAEIFAAEQGVANVRFEVGNAYSLSFSNDSFDAVFIHGVLDHLSEPTRALREAWRVLKSGGIIGLRHGDRQGAVGFPEFELIEELGELQERLWIRNGGNPYIGRTQRKLLRETGFVQIEASASCYCLGTSDAARAAMEGILIPMYLERATEWIDLGWTSQEKVDAMIQACREWAKHPDVFHTFPWCEAVGWKE
jgi:SAM-dependent methyltransferase